MRAALISLVFFVGCVGQTGGQSIDFPVAAAGPADARAGQPLAFTEGGFDVVLTRATLHVGAIYLDQAAPVSGGQATGCYLTGTYVAQETSSLDVDLLDPTPHRFAAPATGITEPPALVGQVWLTGGDVNATADTTPILVFAGSATANGATLPFAGTITIGANRQAATTGAAGGDPICKLRIVTPVPAALVIQTRGGLLLRVDPRRLFDGIDFTQVPADPTSGVRTFSDDPKAASYQPTGFDLFYNLETIAPYAFSWSTAL